MDELKKTEMR